MNTNNPSAAGLTRVQAVLFFARCEERLAKVGRADMAAAVALAAIAGFARSWTQAPPSGRPTCALKFRMLSQRAVELARRRGSGATMVLAKVAADVQSVMTHRGSPDGFDREARAVGDDMIKASGLDAAGTAVEKQWQGDLITAMVSRDLAGVGRLMNGRGHAVNHAVNHAAPYKKKRSKHSMVSKTSKASAPAKGAATIAGIDRQRVSAPQFGVQDQRRARRAA